MQSFLCKSGVGNPSYARWRTSILLRCWSTCAAPERDDLIGVESAEVLGRPIHPPHYDVVYAGKCTETDMNTWIVRSAVAVGGADVACDRPIAGCHADGRADCVPPKLIENTEHDPMAAIGNDVSQ